MPDPLEPPYLAAWTGLLRAHATALARIEERLAAAGAVPLTSYDVLLELSSAPGRALRMGELAERVVLSRSGLTRLVERLEREGLLARRPAEDDRRGTEAVLTEAGRRALREAWPSYAAGIREEFAAFLDADEAAVLARALTRVARRGRQRGGAAAGP